MPAPFNYNTNIPLGTQRPSQSAPEFLTNFNSIHDYVAINHVGFTDPGGDDGKHWLLTMVDNAATPAAPSTSEINVYNKIPVLADNDKVTLTTQELFIQRMGVAESHFPFTASGGTSPNGWTFLPSGILMKWGRVQGSIVSNPLTMFPTTPGTPAFVGDPTVLVTPWTNGSGADPNRSYYVISATSADFRVLVTTRTTSSLVTAGNFIWLAIGSGV